MADKPHEGDIWRHIREAQTIFEGEDQLPRYVARLEVAECAKILEVSPIELPYLAAKRDKCRVEKGRETQLRGSDSDLDVAYTL